ncbi:MAG: transporter substrate-binding domain-containing protein [Eubacterium sp.]|nr:transporter substrate-binding domain-containing protein [Eubacterium sp.]
MRKILAIGLSMVMILSFTACGNTGKKTSKDNGKVLTVGFDAEYPPYGYMDQESGEYVGFDLDLAEKVCEMEGWELEKKPINWDTKDTELNSGSIDCIWNGFTINGRENDYEWSEPYINNTQVIVVADNSGIITLQDLKDKTVGVQAASAAEALFAEDGAQVELGKTFKALNPFSDYNTAFTELQSGSIDALAIDIGVAKYQLKERGEGFVILDEQLNSEQYGVGMKKGNQELCEIINKDLKKLNADGTVEELAKKYDIDPAMICIGE